MGSNGQSAYVQGWQLLDHRLQWIARDDDVAVPVPTVLVAFCALRVGVDLLLLLLELEAMGDALDVRAPTLGMLFFRLQRG